MLDKAINAALTSTTRIFSLLHVEINWKPGKTECFLQYRGHGANRRLDARRMDGNRLAVRVPGSSAAINVVETYKHLGSIIARDASLAQDAVVKVQSALGAYMPISLKVFGSTRIAVTLKFTFLWKL